MITKQTNSQIILQIHVQPNAKENIIIGMHGDYLKIKIKAPAEAGKANTALLKFLASKLKIPEQDIVLKHGKQSKYKKVIIKNCDELPTWLTQNSE